jgi:hypothetical protein
MDQYLAASEFPDQGCNTALGVSAENDLGRRKIMKVEHKASS